MAKDVKFLISASVAKAEAEIRRLQATGADVSSILQREFTQLGTTSSLAFERKRQAAQSAYDRIKTSGMATKDELERSQKALGDRLVAIDQEQFGRRTSLLDKFKANWLATGAAIGAAWLAVSQAWSLAEEAAKGQQQRSSFANLAASHGANAQQIIDNLKAVSGQTIDTRTLIEKAGTAMLTGIPADKLSRLMEIARASSRITGQSITKSFEDISMAVARNSRMILDNLGIIVSEEKAQKDYAASLGKAVDKLTDAEKKQSFMNATLKAGDEIIKRVGVTAETSAEKMQRFTARMKDLKETVGVGLLAALTAVSGAINLTASGALFLSGGIFKVIEGVAWLTRQKDAMAEWKLNADAAFAAARDLGKKGLGDLGMAMDLVSGKLDPLATGMKQLTDSGKDAEEEARKRAELLLKYKETAKQILTVEKARYQTLVTWEKEYAAEIGKQIQKKIQEIDKLKGALASLNDSLAEQDQRRADSLTPALDPALDAYEKYFAQIALLRKQEAAADTIEDGDKKQKALLQIRDGWSKITSEVKVGNDLIITQQEVLKVSQGEMDRLAEKTKGDLEQRIGLAEKEKAALVAMFSAAETEADRFGRMVERIDLMLGNLNNKEVVINFKATGLDQISRVNGIMDVGYTGQPAGSGTVRSPSSYYQVGDSMYWGDGSFAGPALAKGTPYVPADGFAYLHKGEAVIPASQNNAGSGNLTLSIGDIIVQGGATGTETAREIARAIYPELQKLSGRTLARA